MRKRHVAPRTKRQILITVLLTGAMSLAPNVGAGQAASIPDFSGLWGRDSLNLESPLSGPGPVVNMMHTPAGVMDMNKLVGDYTNPILKPEAAAILKKRGELSLAGMSVPNAHEQCRPEPPPFIFAVQFAMEMLQQKNEVTILYSHDNKVRHVRMNVPHPAHVTPSGQGDSVGRYDGDTLVIDTVGIKATPISALDWYGTPHSDALHVVERYRLIDGEAAKQAAQRHDRQYRVGYRPNPNGVLLDPNYKGKGLQVELTVEDKDMFTMPWTALVTYQRAEGELWEMRCAENPFEYYAGADAAIPTADRPDF
jgi:hypothetical protein